jgi:hypothetical protein
VSQLELLARAQAVHIQDPRHGQDPVQVVDLVLEQLGELAVEAVFVPGAVQSLPADIDPRVAQHLAE